MLSLTAGMSDSSRAPPEPSESDFSTAPPEPSEGELLAWREVNRMKNRLDLEQRLHLRTTKELDDTTRQLEAVQSDNQTKQMWVKHWEAEVRCRQDELNPTRVREDQA